MQSCLELIPADTRRVILAFSGGLDSCVLLHLLVASKPSWKLLPWHVNHGLLETAMQMEQFCRQRAHDYGLDFRVEQLDLGNIKSNIEAEARHQRYRVFERGAEQGDCILTAHHADDQAETFLLNAMRGSGVAGLRGIARQRKLGDALLLRPLLDFSRDRLETYARENDIECFDDPSNRESRFDRNYLRNQVIPLIRARWPGFEQSLGNASSLQFEAQDLLDQLAKIDFDAVESDDSEGSATLQLDGLLSLLAIRQKNLIRYWINNAGYSAMPQARLEELLKQLHSKEDASPEISMPQYSVRMYDRRLFLVPASTTLYPPGEYDFGQQQTIKVSEHDLCLQRAAILGLLGIEEREQTLMLKFRNEGEENSDRHQLKRLFQKHRVPPWQRERVAQVYLNGKLEGILI